MRMIVALLIQSSRFAAVCFQLFMYCKSPALGEKYLIIIHAYDSNYRSKKQAKHAAALQCLQSGFIQIKDTNLSQQAMQVQMMENNIDFTSDDPMDQKGLNFEEVENPVKAGEKRKLEELNQDATNNKAENNGKAPTKRMKISASDKNPVMLLNELKPGLKYEVEECGDSPATKRFVMTVSIDNHTFEGSGASKKLAKQACARMALTTLYNFSFTPGLTMETDSEQEEKDQKVPGTRFKVFFRNLAS